MERYTKKNVFKRAFSRFKRRRYGSSRFSTWKNPKYSELKIRAEYMDTLYCPALVSNWKHQYSTSEYFSFYSMLNICPSFTGLLNEFDLYKVTGAAIEIMPSIPPVSASFANGLPSIAIGCFPVDVNTVIGSSVFGSESSISCYLLQTRPVRKYFSFPDNYMNGAVVGIGTWNKTDSYTSQQGEFCAVMPDSNSNLSATATYCFTVTYSLYITYKLRSR